MIRFCCTFFLYAVLFQISSTEYSRHKRYVAFPEGSTLSMSFSLAIPTLSIQPITFGESVNWGIAYELPNATYLTNFDTKSTAHRRQRRNLYNKMEILMESFGLDGRACVCRALCESEQSLQPQGANIIEGLIRTVFRFPLEQISKSEPKEHIFYQRARNMGQMGQDCVQLYSKCPVSLIDLALIQLYSD